MSSPPAGPHEGARRDTGTGGVAHAHDGAKETALLEVGGGEKADKTPEAPAELKVVSYNIRYRAGDDLKQLVKLLKEDPEIGGAHVIGAPWDSVVVAAFSLATYVWGGRSGTRYMTARPEMVQRLRSDADHDRGDTPEQALA